MMTNLLGKPVQFGYNKQERKPGEIVAVYVARSRVQLGVCDTLGNLYFDLDVDDVQIGELPVSDKFHDIFVFWPPDKKIMCIKVCREILGIGLREAKDLVEGNISGVPLGKFNSENTKRHKDTIYRNGLECRTNPELI